MPLDSATIEALLKGDLKKSATGSGGTASLPRPIQLGPLKWADVTAPCTSRGCTSPTYIRIEGTAKCTNHALHALNELWLQEHEPSSIDKCTCVSGVQSRYNIHTYDCALVKLTAEDKDELL